MAFYSLNLDGFMLQSNPYKIINNWTRFFNLFCILSTFIKCPCMLISFTQICPSGQNMLGLFWSDWHFPFKFSLNNSNCLNWMFVSLSFWNGYLVAFYEYCDQIPLSNLFVYGIIFKHFQLDMMTFVKFWYHVKIMSKCCRSMILILKMHFWKKVFVFFLKRAASLMVG